MAGDLGTGVLKAGADVTDLTKNVKAGTDEAKGHVRSMTSDIKHSLKGLKLADHEAFGGLSKVGLGALKAGWLGLAVGGIAIAGSEIYKLVTGEREAKEELQKINDEAKRFHQLTDQNIEATNAWIASLTTRLGTGEAKEGIGNALEGAKADLDREKAKRDEMRSKLLDFSDPSKAAHWASTSLGGLVTTGPRDKAKLEEKLKSQESLVDKYQSQVDKITLLNRFQANAWANPAARNAMSDFVDKQKDAVNNLQKNPDTNELNKLKRQFNFKDEDLGEAKLAIAAKNIAVADDWIKTLDKDIGNLTNNIHLNEDELKLQKLVDQGVVTSQLQQIQQLIDKKKELNAKHVPNTAILKGSREDVALDARNKFEADKRSTDKINTAQLADIISKLVQVNLSIVKLQRQPEEV